VRRKFRRTIFIWSAELPVSDKDFLLYPHRHRRRSCLPWLRHSDDGGGARSPRQQAGLISFRCPNCGRSEKLLLEE
jgi:hypothetical protein